jgi:membrane protein
MKYLSLARTAANGWIEDRAPSMGAALSYYTIFSVAPLLLIVISLAGIFLGDEAARGAIVAQIGGMVGKDGAEAIETLVQNVSKPGKGAVGTVVGVLLLLVGATTVFAELQDDLNRIWKAPNVKPPDGGWGWLRARVLSIGMILAIGFLLLVSLVASAAIATVGDWFAGLAGAREVLAQGVNMVVSFAIVTALFALIYRYLPQVHIRWHDVWIGAAVTAALFTVGKWLIGLYIGKSAVASGFGAAGSLAVLLIWIYYSAQIFLLGAEFTWAFANAYGSRRASPQATQALSTAAVETAEPAMSAGVEAAAPAERTAAFREPTAPLSRGIEMAGAASDTRGPAAKALRRRPVPSLLGIATLAAVLALVQRLVVTRRFPSRPTR